MNNRLVKRNRRRTKRALRVRKRLKAAGHPRLVVMKSNTNIYVQLIDDTQGKVLAATSTNAKEFQGTEFAKKNTTSGRKLGETMAERIKGLQLDKIAFDRGQSKFHGIFKAVADGLRDNGVNV